MMRLCLLAGLLAAGSAEAQDSNYRCNGLDAAASLPSIEGKNGVFYRVLADLRMRHPMTDPIIGKMGTLAATLAANGTTLIYVSVPTKSQAMPDQLPEAAKMYQFDAGTAKLVYDDIITRLTAQNITAPDILDALRAAPDEAPPFFQADFHWTPEGARRAAEAISDVMKAQPFYADLDKTDYVTTELPAVAAFSTMRRTLQAQCIDELPRVEASVFVTKASGASVADAADIFAGGDQEIQVVLVGTSFSDSTTNNFAGFLSQYSGLDVVNYAVTGGNQYGAITSYLTSRDYLENPPRFLVWENPVYNNLAQYGLDPLEELIAAAGDSCTDILSTTQTGPATLTADLRNFSITADNVLLADFGTDGPRRADFVFTGPTGIVRNAAMIRGDRLLASGRFFKPLHSLWQPDMQTVSVTFDQPVTALSSLTLCTQTPKDKS